MRNGPAARIKPRLSLALGCRLIAVFFNNKKSLRCAHSPTRGLMRGRALCRSVDSVVLSLSRLSRLCRARVVCLVLRNTARPASRLTSGKCTSAVPHGRPYVSITPDCVSHWRLSLADAQSGKQSSLQQLRNSGTGSGDKVDKVNRALDSDRRSSTLTGERACRNLSTVGYCGLLWVDVG